MARSTFGNVRRLKSGNWQVRYVHPYNSYTTTGSPNQISAGTYRTKVEAMNRLNELWRQVRDGEWTSPEELAVQRITQIKEAQTRAVTFGDYANSWLENRRLTPETERSYRAYLNNHILPRWSDYAVAGITTAEIRKWLGQLAPSRPGARRKSFEVFRTILNSAVDDDVIAVNPCKRNMLNTVKAATSSKPHKRRKRQPRALTMQQLKAAADKVPPYMRLLVLLSGLTGLRAGEARALRGRHVVNGGPDSATVVRVEEAYSGEGQNLHKGTPKTEKSRREVTVPAIIAEEITALAKRAGANGLLFPAASSPTMVMPLSTYEGALRRLERYPEIGYVTPHDLRHTASSLMQANGVSKQVVADILGHTTTVMTQRYTHTYQQQRIAAAQTMSAAFTDEGATVASLDRKRAAQ